MSSQAFQFSHFIAYARKIKVKYFRMHSRRNFEEMSKSFFERVGQRKFFFENNNLKLLIEQRHLIKNRKRKTPYYLRIKNK